MQKYIINPRRACAARVTVLVSKVSETGVPLRPRGQYLGLEVPGLAEGRPSLLLGDRVVATVAIQEEEEEERGGGRYWEGFIHEVISCAKTMLMLKYYSVR